MLDLIVLVALVIACAIYLVMEYRAEGKEELPIGSDEPR